MTYIILTYIKKRDKLHIRKIQKYARIGILEFRDCRLCERRHMMERMWVLVLLVIGVMMLCKPKLMFRIETLFTVKGGEPTELYLILMRLGGLFFTICSIVVAIHYV